MKKEHLQSHDPEARMREEAINRYIAGEKPSTICREIGRSRTWFYKALSRYQQSGREGLESQSRRPKRIAKQTDEAIEAAIVRVRQTITRGEDPVLRYGNIGAEMIASELEKAGLAPPSLSTINRILRKHGLQKPREKQHKKRQLPRDYPWPQVSQPNQLHLFDFVTRRLKSGQRVTGCNLLDQHQQWPYLRLITGKTKQNVADFLVAAWQEIGLPTTLYLDNDTVWRGSSSGKRSFSFIVRLCLLLGIEVVFIPPYTPEANSLIENFNGIWNRNFWQRTTFTSVDHMRTELPYFETWARERRPLSEHERRSPNQLYPDFKPVCLPADFSQHRQPSLPLTSGLIHFIRFPDHARSFSILNEHWTIEDSAFSANTIRATIHIAQQQLLVYHQSDPLAVPTVIARFPYELSETVHPLSSLFQRESFPLWPRS